MVHWTSTDPKPRLPFCWLCSRRLYGRQHAEREIDGAVRILHKDCANDHDRGESGVSDG